MKTIYTITPSWLMKNQAELAKGVRTIEKLGLRVKNAVFKKRLPSPREKARELMAAYLDRTSDIILAQRGGYSSLKILPFVNFDLIKKHPKVLAGFSDMSTLLNSVYERTGQITLHSPMIINLDKPTRFTERSFMNALNGFPEKDLLKGAPFKVFRHGKASGVLKGGNLVTITSLMGSKWDMVTAGSIVFLEDVDEELHRIDRYLTQWILAGKFKDVKGLILGDFRKIKSEDVFKILSSQLQMHIPVIYCPYIGHVKNKITLPVGARVRLDTNAKSLVIT